LTYKDVLFILPCHGDSIISDKLAQGGKMAQIKERRKFNFVLLVVLVIVIIAGIFYQFFLKF
jgi:hypothetical protein